MKKIIMLVSLSLIFIATAFSQLTGKPAPQTLPTPKIPPFKPAVLQIISTHLNSAEFNKGNKVEYIAVKVAIKNTGQLNAVATKLVGSLKDANGGTITTADNMVDIPIIEGAQTFVHDCVFKFSAAHFGNANRTVNFRLNLISQAASAVDGSNNILTGILIGL